jgi:hypothetical protein
MSSHLKEWLSLLQKLVVLVCRFAHLEVRGEGGGCI